MSTQRLEDCRRGLPEQLVEGERESLAERPLNLASGCRKKGAIATTKNDLPFWLQGHRDAWSGQRFAEMRCKELKVCSFLCREADPMARCSLLEQRSDYSPGTS